MSEGKEVRVAYDGPDITHDELLGKIGQHNSEDAARASSAAETRADIGIFLEDTDLNPKAYSWFRQILKIAAKNQAKAMDVIRSIEVGLPMIKNDISGQEEMDFEGGTVADDEDPIEEPIEDTCVEDGESAEFNAQVDDVVTPVDFGGAAG